MANSQWLKKLEKMKEKMKGQTKRTNKKSKKLGFQDRAGFIVNMFREMPEKRFTLKALAAASGGADRDGRRPGIPSEAPFPYTGIRIPGTAMSRVSRVSIPCPPSLASSSA